jgi:hypothetical protein
MYRNGGRASVMSSNGTDTSADRQVMLNMAAHLDQLACDVEDIEGIISALSAKNNGDTDPSSIERLQKVDTLRQSLRDLAKLSLALAHSGGDREHALRSLHLSSTRNLLADADQAMASHTGTVELF